MDEERYQIEGQLGSGNFGTVYVARHAGLHRLVALKLISVRADGDELLEEARKLASLPEHDNVVKVHDAGLWDDGHVFIASDLCLGGSLTELADGHPIDPARACELISETCRGLEHLHQNGLLHLDIRPANILLSDTGTPRLGDFGLARWTHDAAVQHWYGPHAAPELVETGRAEPATDIYAMGMTLAHVLTGGRICRPFPVEAELVQASADGDWPRLDKLGTNIPSKLRKVIATATGYHPSSRPGSAGAFKRNLDKATPAISFTEQNDGSLVSVGGEWSITVEQRKVGCAVDVRRNGRRRKTRCVEGLTAAQAARHVQKLVTQFASEGP